MDGRPEPTHIVVCVVPIAQDREAIDAELALMATDEEYLREAKQVEAEFAQASWEAFQLSEAQHRDEVTFTSSV